MKKSLKVCLIGCGNMVLGYHGPSLYKYAQENPDTILSACCDLDIQKAERCSKQFGFEHFYNDYNSMLSSEKPDAVCLVVPVHQTAKMAVDILTLGYPLLTEKPPGLTLAEFDQIIQAARVSRVQNQTAFNRRYMPLTVALKKAIAQFDVEEIQTIHYDFHRVGRLDADFSTTAIHAIDTARFLSGSNYRFVEISYQSFPHLGENVANIDLIGQLNSGCRVSIHLRPISGVSQEKITITLEDHTFVLEIPLYSQINPEGELRHYHMGKINTFHTGAETKCNQIDFIAAGFYGGNATFLDALHQNRPVPGPISDGRQSVAIMEAVRLRKTLLRFDD